MASKGRRKSDQAPLTFTYKDKGTDREIIKVMPGGQAVSRRATDLISTILGSCVAVCAYDPVIRVGGMNHFMLPQDEEGLWGGASLALRYGNHAMESLLNNLVAIGAMRSRMECKLFGGATVGAAGKVSKIGQKNINFITTYVQVEKLKVVSRDLGGEHGRRILFEPTTGKAWRRWLTSGDDQKLSREEQKYRAAPQELTKKTDIELF